MAQGMCLALLIFIVLANIETTISIDHVLPSMRDLSSLNINTSSFTAAASGRIIASSIDESIFANYYAVYETNTEATGQYTGAMATLDVYSFPSLMSDMGFTGALIWVSNGKPRASDYNDMQAGWMVNPSRFGDSKTRFFVYWTADGHKSTGCFNLDCDGFVPVKDAPITPGDTLEPANGQPKISFKIFKNKDDGDWWLHFGYDINNLKPVGFWPKSIFTNLEDHAGDVAWGGYTKCYKGHASPPMGNGQWPGKDSASFQNVQLVDSNGQGYAVPVGALYVSANKKCYQASTFLDNLFYYGGPGGCTD